jgi:hypothetical protein
MATIMIIIITSVHFLLNIHIKLKVKFTRNRWANIYRRTIRKRISLFRNEQRRVEQLASGDRWIQRNHRTWGREKPSHENIWIGWINFPGFEPLEKPASNSPNNTEISTEPAYTLHIDHKRSIRIHFYYYLWVLLLTLRSYMHFPD